MIIKEHKHIKLKQVLFFAFYFFLINASSSQNLVLKKAEKHYQQLEYTDALFCFEKIIEKGKPTETDLRHGINCCMQLHNYYSAENYSRKLFQTFSNKLCVSDYIAYINALKYNERYTKADSLIKIMAASYPTNAFVLDHKKRPNYLQELKVDSLNYFIKNSKSINTTFSDFSVTQNNKDSLFYFSSNRRNTYYRNEKFAMDNSYFLDVYQCQKKDSTHFENIKPIKRSIRTKYHDGPVSFSHDGKTMFLTRSNNLKKKKENKENNVVNLKLFIYQLDTLTNTWKEPVSFEYNSDEYSIGHACVNKEKTKLYVVSDMLGGFGKTDIYVCEWQNNKWQKPINLGASINTEEREMFPYVYEDGILFFSSDGRAGLGGLDIYYSAIQYHPNFESRNLGYPLSSSSDDFSILINNNLLSGYVSSNRLGGKGKDDIYFFNSKTLLVKPILTGIIKDEISGGNIPFTKIYLLDKTINKLDSFVVDTTGRYVFSVNENHIYQIKSKETSIYYLYKKDSISLSQSNKVLDVLITPKYKLIFKVADAKNNEPLTDVLITLKNKETNELVKLKTNNKGIFETIIKNKKVGDKISIEFKLEKDEYITVIEDLLLLLDSSTVIELENPMEFKIERIAKGVNLAKVINLKPIYFDYGKWNIKADAALELNKIITLMNENPTIKIELGSHTDCRSSGNYNLKLSALRAKSAAEYMIANGIDKYRIVSKGYGETKPILNGGCEGVRLKVFTEEQHQLNRRTEFIISGF